MVGPLPEIRTRLAALTRQQHARTSTTEDAA
jgi:hypothetical protein